MTIKNIKQPVIKRKSTQINFRPEIKAEIAYFCKMTGRQEATFMTYLWEKFKNSDEFARIFLIDKK